MGQRYDLSVTITAPGITITTSGVSSQVNIPSASSSELPRYIRVAATAAACVRLGNNPVATTNDTQIQPGDALILMVPNGITKIAAIQVASAGAVQISPLENM
jgi:hypothetical protein